MAGGWMMVRASECVAAVVGGFWCTELHVHQIDGLRDGTDGSTSLSQGRAVPGHKRKLSCSASRPAVFAVLVPLLECCKWCWRKKKGSMLAVQGWAWHDEDCT